MECVGCEISGYLDMNSISRVAGICWIYDVKRVCGMRDIWISGYEPHLQSVWDMVDIGYEESVWNAGYVDIWI